MTRDSYIRLTGVIRSHPGRIRFVTVLNRMITGLSYLVYPLFLLALLLTGHPFLLRAVLVPAVSFLGVSLFRKILNAPRPYERFDLPPVLKKDTPGKSFPSRHVFSAFVIAMTVFYLYPAAGCVLLACGAVLAVIRVIGGVHEPRDVIAGALLGLVCAALGYYCI